MSASASPERHTVYLRDYCPPDYRIPEVALRFELDEQDTVVESRLRFEAVYPGDAVVRPLQLDGVDLELLDLALDGAPLATDDYELTDTGLRVLMPPRAGELRIRTRIHPAQNTALEGLYVSGGNFCTQCEAEGFRKITYFPDRPDVMARYTTTVVAEKGRYPVLLSNGNLIEEGGLEGGRHYAVWEDPFPKPSYLFALVAGDLVCKEDTFTTASGREVLLQIWVREGDLEQCDHAMRSLKKAMRWDEQTYGREYDLDRYMIVAVSDFNMGAMENKGLNIFNSRFVLASPETATDTDFVNIEGVIAHEYFHNWSGNRVTCRDWFQLSLKEGFTVFRDQQFTADMNSAAVKRIDDVRLLRTHQFPEDAGPTAHPVRPDAYEEINNFYTLTVYNKGAEVVRMLHTLLGAKTFRRGADLYFERHDGQAVTTDDFLAAMADASDRDLSQFQRWYEQAGTPVVTARGEYDAASRRYRLTLSQSCAPTPGQPQKAPFHIPVAMGLLGPDGEELPLRLEGHNEIARGRVLELTEAEHSFVFEDVTAAPVPSLLRGFSAPVKLEMDLDDEQLGFLMAHDSDPFNRWEAAQRLALRALLGILGAPGGGAGARSVFSRAFGATLRDRDADPALVAEALTLPAEEYVAEFVEQVDPEAIFQARTQMRRELAQAHWAALEERYHALVDHEDYSIEPAAMGRRRLRNLCLAYQAQSGDPAAVKHVRHQFREAANMTDSMAALAALVHNALDGAEEALEAFYQRWREDPLVLDKWFALQAASPAAGAVERVERLIVHPDYNVRNPNRVRSVVAAFAMRNSVGFHRADGEGYRFLADRVLELDQLNPQIAARLVQPLTRWRRFEPGRAELMRTQLERIDAAPGLSPDVREMVGKSL